jgi:RNA polymerase sigma factor (TIGR02999 family)
MQLYERLRALARARMAGERVGHTLDATGLANEAILRLLNCDPARINDEQHFLALAADAMRLVLVDHARKKQAEKRGGQTRPEHLQSDSSEPFRLRAEPETVLALSEALGALEQADPRTATIVKLRAFGGMGCDEIAALLGLSRRTVERHWRFAMADLRTRLTQ